MIGVFVAHTAYNISTHFKPNKYRLVCNNKTKTNIVCRVNRVTATKKNVVCKTYLLILYTFTATQTHIIMGIHLEICLNAIQYCFAIQIYFVFIVVGFSF